MTRITKGIAATSVAFTLAIAGATTLGAQARPMSEGARELRSRCASKFDAALALARTIKSGTRLTTPDSVAGTIEDIAGFPRDLIERNKQVRLKPPVTEIDTWYLCLYDARVLQIQRAFDDPQAASPLTLDDPKHPLAPAARQMQTACATLQDSLVARGKADGNPLWAMADSLHNRLVYWSSFSLDSATWHRDAYSGGRGELLAWAVCILQAREAQLRLAALLPPGVMDAALKGAPVAPAARSATQAAPAVASAPPTAAAATGTASAATQATASVEGAPVPVPVRTLDFAGAPSRAGCVRIQMTSSAPNVPEAMRRHRMGVFPLPFLAEAYTAGQGEANRRAMFVSNTCRESIYVVVLACTEYRMATDGHRDIGGGQQYRWARGDIAGYYTPSLVKELGPGHTWSLGWLVDRVPIEPDNRFHAGGTMLHTLGSVVYGAWPAAPLVTAGKVRDQFNARLGAFDKSYGMTLRGEISILSNEASSGIDAAAWRASMERRHLSFASSCAEVNSSAAW